MTAGDWTRMRRLFEQALALPAEERAAFLDRECKDDSKTRAEIQRLLRADSSAADFMEQTERPDVSELFAAPPTELGPGVQVGRYSLRRMIATGGMGTVWEAVQDRPKRTVAVKTIRMGLATPERRQRFQLEVEVLGRLRHPGIAQIYDAGTHQGTSGSFPYFAMELIEGALDIVTYADQHELSRHERLALFSSVCDAVQHGHQRGIVHRDLKPGNILVDSTGQPKVIDFGLARATRFEDSITTAQTAAGALLGTLLFMSPEQLAGDPEEVDTRSDVYSLGVLLYQLVTGELPHDTDGLPIQRMIIVLRENEPRRPAGVSADLVRVIFRALEKDPARRYASASELAADVRRFVQHDPVLAGPPTLRYRLRKMIRRHRVLVGMGSLVFLALSIGMAGVIWQAREARAEAELAVRINEFFDEMLLSPTPSESGRDVPMSAVLDAAAARIADEFADRPDVQARIRTSIGKAYQQLGRYQEALPHLQVALQAALAEFGELDLTTADAMHNYASSLRRTYEHEQAEPFCRRLVAIRTQLHGPTHFETSGARVTLSTVLMELGETEEGFLIVEDLMGMLPEEDDKRAHYVAVSIMNNYSGLLYLSGKHEEALTQAELTTEYAVEHLGEQDPYTSMAYGMYAIRLMDVGRLDEAEEVFRLALELMVETLGETDFDLIHCLNNYGQLLNARGRPAEAEPVLRKAYERGKLNRSRHLAPSRDGLVGALVALDRSAEAITLLRADLAESNSAEDKRRIVLMLAQVLENNGSAREGAELRTELENE